ncbi:hypothetical protein [Peterkaempfera bronchialis]|nr:hypothetical protein [Peterkaempfera bronchialis]
MWETAVLVGGPADGVQVRVADRPLVLQVTLPCPVEGTAGELTVEALHVYRRKGGQPPLRYGFDPASP